MAGSTAIQARRAPLSGRRLKQNSARRRCAQDDCTTRLSRYNHAERCFLHKAVTYPTVRGVKRVRRPATA